MTKKTITVDLEAYTPCTLGSVTYGIHPGKTLMYVAGRQTGKSMLNQWYNNNLCNEIILPMRPEPKSKYNFSRKWYIAEFDTKHYDEVRDWCTEHFGTEDKFPNSWSRWQHRYEDRIFFRDEKDYMFFVLRWS